MNNQNSHINMDNEHQHQGDGGFMNIAIGFILAVGNNLFGWLNNIHFTADWNAYLQAAVTGFVGATFAFFANKFWKVIERKLKKNKGQQQ